MDKKGIGSDMGIGIIITVFMGVIIALALFNGGIVTNVASTTNLQGFNTSSGDAAFTPLGGGALQSLEGKLVSDFVVVNATGGNINSGNFSLLDNQIVDGTLTARINWTGEQAGTALNISYNFQPTGYISNAGGRALADLIIIFTALAIGMIVLIVIMKDRDFMGMFGK